VESIKRYTKIDRANSSENFSIAAMEAIYDERGGATDEPHRHDYYTVLLVKQSQGQHHIDFNQYDLAGQQVFFVAPGQVHQVVEQERSEGFVITFTTDFLVMNAIPLGFIEDLNLFHDYGESPPLQPAATAFEQLLHFAEQMQALMQSDEELMELSLGAYLKLFLIKCKQSCSLHPDESALKFVGGHLVRDFKALVNTHYRQEHAASFYADQLHITADHLNRTIKGAIGKTAKEYIQSRITTEAKRLLCFSGASAKEVGYSLGFSEPSNFSAFFKKCTGLSPSKFMESVQSA